MTISLSPKFFLLYYVTPSPETGRISGFHYFQLCAHQIYKELLVSWCFEPSQPQRITFGLEANLNPSPSLDINIKQNIHMYKQQAEIFNETVNQISALLKTHIRLRHAGVMDRSV